MKFFLAVVPFLFLTCKNPAAFRQSDLIGKTIEYRYGESVYHVTFTSDSTLSWEAVTGDEQGVQARETYVAEQVAPHMLFITWGEENGVGVSQLLDFERGKVHNHLLHGRQASRGLGEIRILKD